MFVPGIVLALASMPLLLLAKVPNNSIRLSARIGQPEHNARPEHKRIVLALPRRAWFLDRLQTHGLTLAQPQDRLLPVAIIGAVVVSAGQEFRGPLTPDWSQELRFLQEFYANAVDCYSLVVQERWALAAPIEVDFRKALRGTSGIAVVACHHALYVPVISDSDLDTQCQLQGEGLPVAPVPPQQGGCSLRRLLQQHGFRQGLRLGFP